MSIVCLPPESHRCVAFDTLFYPGQARRRSNRARIAAERKAAGTFDERESALQDLLAGMLRYEPSARLSSADCLLRDDVFNPASTNRDGRAAGGARGGSGGGADVSTAGEKTKDVFRVGEGGGVVTGDTVISALSAGTGAVSGEKAVGSTVAVVHKPNMASDKRRAEGIGGRSEAEEALAVAEEEHRNEPGWGKDVRRPPTILPDDPEQPEETALVGEAGYVKKRVGEIEQIEEYFAKRAGRKDGAIRKGVENSFDSSWEELKGGASSPKPTGNQPPPQPETRLDTGGGDPMAAVAVDGHSTAEGDATVSEEPVASAVKVDSQQSKEPSGEVPRDGYDSDSFDEDDNDATVAVETSKPSDKTNLGDTAVDSTTTPEAAVSVPEEDHDAADDATLGRNEEVDPSSSSEKEDRPPSPDFVRYLDGAEVAYEEGEGGEDGWRVAGAFRVLVASGPGGELAGRAMRRMLLSTSRRRNQKQQQSQPGQ